MVSAALDTYRLRCAPCHGSEGRGDGPAAAALNPKPRDFGLADWQATISDRQIETAILRGGAAIGRSPVMPANPDLAGRPDIIEALRRAIRGFAVAAPAPAP